MRHILSVCWLELVFLWPVCMVCRTWALSYCTNLSISMFSSHVKTVSTAKLGCSESHTHHLHMYLWCLGLPLVFPKRFLNPHPMVLVWMTALMLAISIHALCGWYQTLILLTWVSRIYIPVFVVFAPVFTSPSIELKDHFEWLFGSCQTIFHSSPCSHFSAHLRKPSKKLFFHL